MKVTSDTALPCDLSEMRLHSFVSVCLQWSEISVFFVFFFLLYFKLWTYKTFTWFYHQNHTMRYQFILLICMFMSLLSFLLETENFLLILRDSNCHGFCKWFSFFSVDCFLKLFIFLTFRSLRFYVIESINLFLWYCAINFMLRRVFPHHEDKYLFFVLIAFIFWLLTFLCKMEAVFVLAQWGFNET